MADQHVTVAPNTTGTMRVRVGPQTARATVDGKVVDEGPMEVVSGNDAFVWNVGGAAPLLTAQIKYYAVTPANEEEPQESYYCGQRLLVVEDVDFLFREPDKTVSLGKGQQVAVRTLLTAAWGSDGSRLPPCLSLLLFREDERGLKLTADALSIAGDVPVQTAIEPVTLALFNGHDADAWAWANELHARGFDPTVERARVWIAEETGHLDEVAKELEAASTAHPDDGERAALALFARTTPPALKEIEPVLEKFPEVDRLLEGAQAAAEREGDHARVVDYWLRRAKAGSSYACYDGTEVALSAVRAGKEKEVLEALEGCLDDENAAVSRVVAAAVVLDKAQHRDPTPRLDVLEKDPVRQRTALLAGLEAEGAVPPALQPLAKLVAGTATGSSAVLSAAAALPPLERKMLDDELGLIAWTTAVAQHDATEKWLERRVRLRPSSRKALRDFISGATKELPALQLGPLPRAAAYLARSEVADLPPPEKKRLRELGKKEAVGSRFLLAALERWP